MRMKDKEKIIGVFEVRGMWVVWSLIPSIRSCSLLKAPVC